MCGVPHTECAVYNRYLATKNTSSSTSARKPPTTIISAQIDPLRSDGELLAAKLRAAGVPVEQRTFQGVTHEFFGMGAAVPKAKAAETLALSRLVGAFAR